MPLPVNLHDCALQDLAGRLEALEAQAREREAELQARSALVSTLQADVTRLTDKLNDARRQTAAASSSTAPLEQQLTDVQVGHCCAVFHFDPAVLVKVCEERRCGFSVGLHLTQNFELCRAWRTCCWSATSS